MNQANIAQPSGAPEVPPDKFDDVLLPFLTLMRRELHANTGKGDRPGWLKMDANTALLEVYYHLSKLQKAVKHNDGPAIQEFSADVANMAMMVLDVCGGLVWVDAAPTPSGAPADTTKARFENVSCSQCGGEFGPGNEGYSHCSDHEESATGPSPGDLLDMAYINSLPQPFIGRELGGGEWPIYDFDTQTGLVRIDVCGKLQVKHIGDFTSFCDGAGVVRSAEAFYLDASPEDRAASPSAQPSGAPEVQPERCAMLQTLQECKEYLRADPSTVGGRPEAERLVKRIEETMKGQQ